jgi:hypothetical protein
MARRWIAGRIVVCALLTLGLLQACGLRSSGIATRPPGHVKEDAGPDVPSVPGIDAPQSTTKRDAAGLATVPTPDSPDCQGTEEQVNDCIINAPTKSGIPATRGKPSLTYQTCGAQ